jgi:hypothetical protein
VDHVPNPENLVAPGIEPGTSGFVTRNPDHYTTEVVSFFGNARNSVNFYSSVEENIHVVD